jgi:hypothetical protein
MSAENSEYKPRQIKIWQVAILAILLVAAIGQFTGSSDSSSNQTSNSTQVTESKEASVDLFTARACRKFREFVSEGGKGVLTIPEMREKFRPAYESAQFSEIPAVVTSATRTMAALTSEDVDEFATSSKVLADACLAAGQ